jgi:hypothetical protein
MGRWFSSEEAVHFFAFLQETLDGVTGQLVTNNKRWVTQTGADGKVVAAEREDVSDFLRGQMTTLEQIINTPATLRSGIKKELEALLAAEGE